MDNKKGMWICNSRNECNETECYHYESHEWSEIQECHTHTCLDWDGYIECVPEDAGDDDLLAYDVGIIRTAYGFLDVTVKAKNKESAIDEAIRRAEKVGIPETDFNCKVWDIKQVEKKGE